MVDWQALERSLARELGRGCRLHGQRAAGGGCINQAWALETSLGPLFLKLNRAERADLFSAEWDGLATLRSTGALRVPEPLARGVDAGASWLLLEYIELQPLTAASAAAFGEALASMHRAGGPGFGHHRDNYIGLTPQSNRRAEQWPEFFRDRRLWPQIELARDRGAPPALLADLEAIGGRVDELLAGHHCAPSLLHGDLWGGNCAADPEGRPVLFDPAVYSGDREADLAMSELFGRLPGAFYQAYDASWPLETGYARRRTLYNLYHVLNHYNLFGGGYAAQAQQLCRELLG